MKGIIFSSESVIAIMAGRKTQTRRVLKDQYAFRDWTHAEPLTRESFDGMFAGAKEGDCILQHERGPLVDMLWLPVCPRYRPGEVLYVKETWHESIDPLSDIPLYKTDFPAGSYDGTHDTLEPWGAWRSPLFMPEWAARTKIRVVSARVERLRDVTDADCVAEGVEWIGNDIPGGPEWWDPSRRCRVDTPREAFAGHWDALNAEPKLVCDHYEAYPWSNESIDALYPDVREKGVWRGKPLVVCANPWVWRYESEVAK